MGGPSRTRGGFQIRFFISEHVSRCRLVAKSGALSRNNRNGGVCTSQAQGEIIASGNLADDCGYYVVKRITPSSTGNGQRFGQDEARYDQRTFVRVETKSGVAPGLCQLAELLQFEPSGHHQRGSL